MASVFDRYEAVIVLSDKAYLDKTLTFRNALSEAGIEAAIVHLGMLEDTPEYCTSTMGHFIMGSIDRVITAANMPLSDKYYIGICANNAAWIYDKSAFDDVSGYVLPNPSTERVRTVSYHNRKTQVSLISDYYNNQGQMFSRVIKDSTGAVINQTYFDALGKEVICEDYSTGFIRLLHEDRYYCFADRIKFNDWFFKQFDLFSKKLIFAGRDNKVRSICINAVDTVQLCSSTADRDCDKGFNCKYRIFDDADVELHENEYRLGKIFNFTHRDAFSKDCIIHVNKATLDKAYELVRSLSSFNFHIIVDDDDTIDCLTKFADTKNTKVYHLDLYLSFKGIMQKLMKSCSLAVDIDGELMQFEEDMFLNNVLMFSLSGKAGRYVPESHVQNPSQFISSMLFISVSKRAYEDALRKQQSCICKSSLEDYKEFVREVFNK